ncbi:phospholipase/carboxylesterase [Pedobacter sp. BAL39]|uniref:alpha/beta hydrolase n=1 Tax=Pedobacter sp. BAL39 TaxID=391596 RepID=UPI00015591F6|nr:dienelactone hydrolase family protein [Pedobacter sp. BAL39]EDM36637.1 phospholipase/carboxylesterase [Pedobacter sp. BAL39]
MYTHQKNIITAGLPIGEASKAVIFLHGRGSSAEDIIALNNHLKINDAALFAPQATNNSWYPYSFMAPEAENQPALDSALAQIDALTTDVVAQGIPLSQIYFVGFSQGACLTLEYITRHAAAYGGAIAFTGGLIGETINLDNYTGDFAQTPIWISTGNPDPHVPVSRVMESKEVIESKNGKVAVQVYPGRPHTITREEITLAVQHVFG